MLIVYGTRIYGRIEAAGCSCLGTQFVHFYFLPVFPLSTYVILEENDGRSKTIESDFSAKSVVAAYARAWGPIAAVASACIGATATLIVGLIERDAVAAAALGLSTLVITQALVIGTVLAWTTLGKLSAEEKSQRAVYARHIGYSVDPALLGESRTQLRSTLGERITERLRSMAAGGYRVSADPRVVWPHAALDPSHHDEKLITAAFTLSRVYASLEQGARKLEMEQLHDRLWQRLTAMSPTDRTPG